MTPTEILARHVAATRLSALPPDAVTATVRCVQDLLGVALAGVGTPWARAAAAAAAADGATGRAAWWGTGVRGSAVAAALVNGTAAHAFDYDDDLGCCHIGAVVIPAALAVAQVRGATPQDLLAAVCAGYDVTLRISDGIDPDRLYARGYHPTAVCGVFGAAAAAGRLLGLSPEALAHALGIAGSFAAGTMEFLSDGAMTKRLQPGKAAADGVLAAHLAAQGFTGPRTALEGPYGLWRYTESLRAERFTADLGVRLAVRETHFKKHACCLSMAAAIDGVLDMVAEAGLGPKDVESIRIGLCKPGWAIVGEPHDPRIPPPTVLAAQMSLRYALAVGLHDGVVGPPQFAESRLGDPELLALARRIDCYVHPALASAIADDVTAYIDLTARDGRRLEHVRRIYRGHPTSPMSDAEMADKFTRTARGVLSDAGAAELLRTIRSLPTERSLEPLLSCLA
jgi:2-methylcitrate dehydratase PrpD